MRQGSLEKHIETVCNRVKATRTLSRRAAQAALLDDALRMLQNFAPAADSRSQFLGRVHCRFGNSRRRFHAGDTGPPSHRDPTYIDGAAGAAFKKPGHRSYFDVSINGYQGGSSASPRRCRPQPAA